MISLKRILALLLAVLLCVSLCACGREEQEKPTAPTRENKPILPGFADPETNQNDYTAVYVTVFDNLAIIATYPVLQNPDPNADPENLEPECPPRELSDGGNILCGGDHEDEYPITRVLITDQLVPKSMSGWFRGMAHLQQIDGLEKILTHHVTDMNHLFAGCGRLSQVNIEGWDVSKVVDMTGIFDDCPALAEKPSWYDWKEAENSANCTE